MRIRCIDFNRIFLFKTLEHAYNNYIKQGFSISEAKNAILLDYPELLSVPRNPVKMYEKETQHPQSAANSHSQEE